MKFVIPMAGRGSRFDHLGYNVPKYFIEVNGKTLFEYSLESLPLDIADSVIFILLKEHDEKYDAVNKIRKLMEDLGYKKETQFVKLPEVTNGQSETVLAAKDYFDLDGDIVIYNIDTHFKSSSLKDILTSDHRRDGVIGAFKDDQDKWSFAKTVDGVVTETAEKVVISNNALTGMYHFRKASDFVRVAEKAISKGETQKGEYYIAPLYNTLIEEGKEFVLDMVDDFLALGTPEDLEKIKS